MSMGDGQHEGHDEGTLLQESSRFLAAAVTVTATATDGGSLLS